MMLNLLNTFHNNNPKINVDSYMIIEKLTNMDNKAINQYDNHYTHSTIANKKPKKSFPIKVNKINKKFVNQILKDKLQNSNLKINTDNNLKENNKLVLINNTFNDNSLNYLYSQTNENSVTKKDNYNFNYNFNYNKAKSTDKHNSTKLKENNPRYDIEEKYKLILQEKNILINTLKNEVEYYKNSYNNNNSLNKINTFKSLNVVKTTKKNQFNTIEVTNNKKNFFLSSSKKNNANYLGLNSSSDNSSSKNILGLNKSNDMDVVTGNNIVNNMNDNYYLNNKNDKKIILKGNDLIKSQLNILKKYNRFVTDNILNNEKKYIYNLHRNNATIDIYKNYMCSPIKINNNRNKVKLDSLDFMTNNSVNSPKRVIYSLNTTSSDKENLANGSSKTVCDDNFQKNKIKMENIKNRMDNLCKNLFAIIENKNNNKDNKYYNDVKIANK